MEKTIKYSQIDWKYYPKEKKIPSFDLKDRYEDSFIVEDKEESSRLVRRTRMAVPTPELREAVRALMKRKEKLYRVKHSGESHESGLIRWGRNGI